MRNVRVENVTQKKEAVGARHFETRHLYHNAHATATEITTSPGKYCHRILAHHSLKSRPCFAKMHPGAITVGSRKGRRSQGLPRVRAMCSANRHRWYRFLYFLWKAHATSTAAPRWFHRLTSSQWGGREVAVSKPGGCGMCLQNLVSVVESMRT